VHKWLIILSFFTGFISYVVIDSLVVQVEHYVGYVCVAGQ